MLWRPQGRAGRSVCSGSPGGGAEQRGPCPEGLQARKTLFSGQKGCFVGTCDAGADGWCPEPQGLSCMVMLWLESTRWPVAVPSAVAGPCWRRGGETSLVQGGRCNGMVEVSCFM